MKKPLILITNDDGVNAKGLGEITRLARPFGDVVVIAPNESYSGMSHAITMHHPLFVQTISQEPGLNVYSVTGSPVDCVKIGLDELLCGREPDLIISGINHGSNANVSVIYSGTMGAATEGCLYKIPSIGFSLTDHDLDADFSAFDTYAPPIIEQMLRADNARRFCLNVNVPNIAPPEIRGVRICRQTRGNWRESFVHRTDPHGRDYYWMRGMFYNDEPQAEDTDEWALSHGYVAIVPVQLDLTDYTRLEQLRGWTF